MEKKYFEKKTFGDPQNVREREDVDYMRSIINKYSHLDFVKRIIDPSDRMEMPSGRTGTHYMVTSPLYGQHVVFPRIIRDKDGSLKLLDKQEALIYARNTGELIPFGSETDALWFSYHYKDLWKSKHQPDGSSVRKYGKIKF